MILEAFACGVFSITEFTKTQHYNLEENTKEKILEQGLYHFTSKDIANKIAKDAYFRPTKGRIRNHFGKDKVYMFAGLPDLDNFSKNLPSKINPFVSGNLEFSAVKVNPNAHELSNFKERLQDSAVVYEGRYDIGNDRAKAVELVIDLNENGECIFREKTEQELENGYVPSKELLDYINKRKIGKGLNEFKILYNEVKAGLTSIPNALPRFYRDFKLKSERKKEMKEFQPYSVELGVLNGEQEYSYNIDCNKLEFYGDKKLNKVSIQKTNKETGEILSYDCYMDGHILNLGDEAAAIYLSKLEKRIELNSLNKVNGICYAGQPMYNLENGDVGIGVSAKFNNLLRERDNANAIGQWHEAADKYYNKRIEQYYKKHPIRKFLDNRARKKGEMPLLLDRNELGIYTNRKLKEFSIKDINQNIEESNGFLVNKRCDFEYKDGSAYSALFGDVVEIDGRKLRKIIVSQEYNELSEKFNDTIKLPQNYYIDDVELDNIDKKDLAKYLSNLEYTKNENEIKVEESGFVGKYVGGVKLDNKGRIKETTYDEALQEKYGKEIHIEKQKTNLDMSEYTYTENDISNNYHEEAQKNNIDHNKELEDKITDELNIV